MAAVSARAFLNRVYGYILVVGTYLVYVDSSSAFKTQNTGTLSSSLSLLDGKGETKLLAGQYGLCTSIPTVWFFGLNKSYRCTTRAYNREHCLYT